jgi:hypothetical protein
LEQRECEAKASMKSKPQFSDDILAALRKSKGLRIQAGTGPHLFIGIWVIVVKNRAFLRSWSSGSTWMVQRTGQGYSTSNGSNVDGENGAGSQLHHPIGCRTKHRKIQGPTATHSHSN